MPARVRPRCTGARLSFPNGSTLGCESSDEIVESELVGAWRPRGMDDWMAGEFASRKGKSCAFGRPWDGANGDALSKPGSEPTLSACAGMAVDAAAAAVERLGDTPGPCARCGLGPRALLLELERHNGVVHASAGVPLEPFTGSCVLIQRRGEGDDVVDF